MHQLPLDLPELFPASPWCQRRSPGRRHSWRHRNEGGFDPRHYGVSGIPELEARRFIEERHYSGTYPAARLRYGLFDLQRQAPELVGAAVLSIPASKSVLTNVFPQLEPYDESLELGRFVLDDAVPGNGETWFLAEVLRLAGAVGVRGLVSFADPLPRTTLDGRIIFPGHRGAIYQAASAEYLGRGTPRTLTLLPNGMVLHPRAMSKIRNQEQGRAYAERLLVAHGASLMNSGDDPRRWLEEALTAANTRRLWHPGNHRYALRAGTRAQRRRVRIPIVRQPYPKDVAIRTRGKR
ncbi:hypothetical protein ACIBHX_47055 [Nonomuraea sp. NPDC050536]|uniref:Mom family adenine methylcarbamoylation protein n=1 Tax=Nonomuraea sp. NPDC050536 TaxID=3364366 RepID=UPI0037C67E52